MQDAFDADGGMLVRLDHRRSADIVVMASVPAVAPDAAQRLRQALGAGPFSRVVLFVSPDPALPDPALPESPGLLRHD
ncbi:MAG: hypothetical protein ACK4GC_07135 [Paracoccaceae bacterium]